MSNCNIDIFLNKLNNYRIGYENQNPKFIMKTKYLSLLILALIISYTCSSQENKKETSKPNIVIILADDFGVGDIQAHYPDNKIPTPYLDKLVDQGMSFKDAHSSSAVCTPTRYGLLTGRYNWRSPLQEWVIACYEPPLIEEDRLTLPQYLKESGYDTACVGKWHLGWNWPSEQPSKRIAEQNGHRGLTVDYSKPILDGPTDRGFDYFFGVDVPNFPPFTFIENRHVVEKPTAKYDYDANEGVVMPKKFDGSPMAPGWEFDKILPKITSKAVDYIKEQSKSKKPFFLYFSMTSPHEPVVPSEKFAGKSGIAPIADFVMETDWSAGQIIKAIDDAGIFENTIVIFTADNGHSHYTGWEALIEAGHLPSGLYRGHKADIWEGGHRVPFIVRWPGKVAPDTENKDLVCLTDVFASCAELVGGGLLPSNSAEDSFSLLPTLLGNNKKEKRESVVSHSVQGEFAYRKGPWKLIFKNPPGGKDEIRGKKTKVQLYNLEEDMGEKINVAIEQPEVVQELTIELNTLIQRGTSRQGSLQQNDVDVDFTTVQMKRWAEPLTNK